MRNLSAVGFRPSDPEDQQQRIYEAVLKLRETLKKVRVAFDDRRMRELDTEIGNAWLIFTDLERRLKALKG